MFSCKSSSFFHHYCNDYCHYCFPTTGKNEDSQEICGVQSHPGAGTHTARNPWRETCGCRRADAGAPAAAGPGSRGCKWPPRERDGSGSRSGLRVRGRRRGALRWAAQGCGRCGPLLSTFRECWPGTWGPAPRRGIGSRAGRSAFSPPPPWGDGPPPRGLVVGAREPSESLIGCGRALGLEPMNWNPGAKEGRGLASPFSHIPQPVGTARGQSGQWGPESLCKGQLTLVSP